MSRFAWRVSSFADAQYRYERTKPFRGWKIFGHERTLSRKDRRPHRVTIRPVFISPETGTQKNCFEPEKTTGYALKLYNTDVVTYWNDGRIVIKPWSSRITEDFASACLPDDFHPKFAGPASMIGVYMHTLTEAIQRRPSWRQPHRYWLISNEMTFIRGNNGHTHYEPSPDTRIDQFENYRDNGKATSRELKKTRYHEFKDWLVVVAGLSGKMLDRPTTYLPIGDWCGFLEAGHAAWITLINNRYYIYGQHDDTPFQSHQQRRERAGTLKVGMILSACVSDIMSCVPDRVYVESYDYIDGLDRAYRVVKSYGRSRQ